MTAAMATDEAGALGAAVMVALEGLCFVSADGFAAAPPSDEPTVTATVAFRGPERGQISLRVPAALLATLFGDILGDAGAAACQDALGELTNIVCGNAVPRVFPAGVYALGAPVFDAPSPVAPRASVVVLAAGGWLHAAIHPEAAS